MRAQPIYVDFIKTDDSGHLKLTCAGTLADLDKYKLKLKEGMVLNLYSDDADEKGKRTDLVVEGVAHYDPLAKHWVAIIDWSAIKNARSGWSWYATRR